MNHKQKVKLARKMRSKEEINDRIPIFSTKAWNKMKDGIRQRAEIAKIIRVKKPNK